MYPIFRRARSNNAVHTHARTRAHTRTRAYTRSYDAHTSVQECRHKRKKVYRTQSQNTNMYPLNDRTTAKSADSLRRLIIRYNDLMFARCRNVRLVRCPVSLARVAHTAPAARAPCTHSERDACISPSTLRAACFRMESRAIVRYNHQSS